MISDSTLEVPEVLSLDELKVSLPLDVYGHLAQQYATATHGDLHLEKILERMKMPPSETCCRVNLLKSSVKEVINALNQHLCNSDVHYNVQRHETINDVVTIKGCPASDDKLSQYYAQEDDTCNEFSSWENRRKKGWPMSRRVVIVDRFCAEAVMRGAYIFIKGILCADAGIKEDEEVAVYVHLSSKSKQVPRGLLLENYLGKCVFIGIGKSNCKRSDYFSQSTGVGVTMIRLAGIAPLPPLNGVLVGKIMLQNLPSAVVVHALDPQKLDVILDMCSAPGGKTSHIASLIDNDGLVIACEKGKKKMEQAKDFFRSMNATCIVPIATDSTKLLLTDTRSTTLSPKEIIEEAEANSENKDVFLKIKGFYPESFDRILLDPPCSALGLRPKLQVDIKSTDELLKHSEYQQHFVRCAVPLLKAGGTMTYSTCTINASENEEIVNFILTQFPCMKLVPISNDLPGVPALPGFGLTEQQCKMIRRFDPCDRDTDSMGFFIAKFQKETL